PPQQLQSVAPRVVEDEERATLRILAEHAPRGLGETIERAAHVDRARRDEDAHRGGDHRRAPSSASTRRLISSRSAPEGTRRTWPLAASTTSNDELVVIECDARSSRNDIAVDAEPDGAASSASTTASLSSFHIHHESVRALIPSRAANAFALSPLRSYRAKIGRASCRERLK